MANLNPHPSTTHNNPANNVGTPTNWKKKKEKKKDFLFLHTDTHADTHRVYTMLLTHAPPPYDIFKLTLSRNYM